jgi:hypothetical protein
VSEVTEEFGLWDLPTFSTVLHLSLFRCTGGMGSPYIKGLAKLFVIIYDATATNSTTVVEHN